MAIQYIGAITETSQIPTWVTGDSIHGHSGPRITFIGRSNVGKSTLLNALAGREIAYSSKKPGKTQAIHFFDDEENKAIWVDLPGYGYAASSQTARDSWAKLIEMYLPADERIELAVLLWDARIGPQKNDMEAFSYIVRDLDLPTVVCLTKIDAYKNQKERSKKQREIKEEIRNLGYDESRVFWVSSKTGKGIRELRRFMSEEVR